MENTGHEILYQENSEEVIKLFKIYKESPHEARIYFLNSSRHKFTTKREVLYEGEDGFDFIIYITQYGISKNNRIYSRDRKELKILCRRNGAWAKHEGSRNLSPLMLGNRCQLHSFNNTSRRIIDNKLKRFYSGWFELLEDITPYSAYKNKSFNFFINKGVYNKKSLLKVIYGFDYPLNKVLHQYDKNDSNYGCDMSMLKHYKDWIVRENKFSDRLVNEDWRLFHDALKMAKICDRKLNLAWSSKRLKQEHDSMAKEISEVINKHDHQELCNDEIFLRFAEEMGYNIIDNMQDLVYEGKRQNHCVATYKNAINSGKSAIYKISKDGVDYTLELNNMHYGNVGVSYGQFKGYSNSSVPTDIVNKVKDDILKFNQSFEVGTRVYVGVKDGVRLNRLLRELNISLYDATNTLNNYFSISDGYVNYSYRPTVKIPQKAVDYLINRFRVVDLTYLANNTLINDTPF